MTDNYIDWKDWRAADFGHFREEEDRYYLRELQSSGITSVSGLRIGELGYGNGAFAGWVRERGGQWVGREAIPELHQRAIQAGFEAVPSGGGFSDAIGRGVLDVMVAFDVIEHLDLADIREFLRDATEALKPGGLLLMRLPSGDSPFSQAIYRGDVTHRTLLGSSAVRQLALGAGLQISQIRSPVLPVAGTGMTRALRRAALTLARWAAFGFIGTVLMGNRGAVLTPNMFVVFCKNEAQTSNQRRAEGVKVRPARAQ